MSFEAKNSTGNKWNSSKPGSLVLTIAKVMVIKKQNINRLKTYVNCKDKYRTKID